MPTWIEIARSNDCPPGHALECLAGERIVALFNVEGVWHALDGICPHQGGPLGRGCLTGGTVTCPWHGWQFAVDTGQHLTNRTLRQPRLPVRQEGDAIWVDVDPAGQ